MTAAYWVTRAGFSGEPITAQAARELYDEAQARPASELTGHPEAGFAFWLGTPDLARRTRIRVEPAAG